VPNDIAPLLYKLSYFKKITVEKELQNNNWIQAVRRISIREELLQFIDLWTTKKLLPKSWSEGRDQLEMGTK
jgi:hypothetical protein